MINLLKRINFRSTAVLLITASAISISNSTKGQASTFGNTIGSLSDFLGWDDTVDSDVMI